MTDILVSAKGLSKRFGAVHAVKDVSFDLMAGEILGLVGDNGAGKSTVIKMLSGVHQPDEGEVLWKGQRVTDWDPRAMRDLGIETIYQDLALAPNLAVPANIFLGKETRRRGVLGVLQFLDHGRMEAASNNVISRLNIHIPSIRSEVGNLSGGQRQSVAIARSILWTASLIIMDEPTAALGVVERSSIVRLVRQLKDEGIAVLIVSHNLPDVFALTDRIMVMQRGKKVGELITSETNEESLVQLIVGGRVPV